MTLHSSMLLSPPSEPIATSVFTLIYGIYPPLVNALESLASQALHLVIGDPPCSGSGSSLCDEGYNKFAAGPQEMTCRLAGSAGGVDRAL